MKPQAIWGAVAIVFILVAGAVTLVALGKDVTIILTLTMLVAVPVITALGGIVVSKLEQVKEQGNGNIQKVLEAQQKTQEQLANLAMILPSLTPKQIEQVKTTSTDIPPEGHDDEPTLRVPTSWGPGGP